MADKIVAREYPRAQSLGLGVAVVATGVAVAIRWLVMPWLGDQCLFITFFPAILLSACLGGLGPGRVATLVGAAADAVGWPTAELFRSRNEQTRAPVADPTAKVLRLCRGRDACVRTGCEVANVAC